MYLILGAHTSLVTRLSRIVYETCSTSQTAYVFHEGIPTISSCFEVEIHLHKVGQGSHSARRCHIYYCSLSIFTISIMFFFGVKFFPLEYQVLHLVSCSFNEISEKRYNSMIQHINKPKILRVCKSLVRTLKAFACGTGFAYIHTHSGRLLEIAVGDGMSNFTKKGRSTVFCYGTYVREIQILAVL